MTPLSEELGDLLQSVSDSDLEVHTGVTLHFDRDDTCLVITPSVDMQEMTQKFGMTIDTSHLHEVMTSPEAEAVGS